jgi:hypothetical protein
LAGGLRTTFPHIVPHLAPHAKEKVKKINGAIWKSGMLQSPAVVDWNATTGGLLLAVSADPERTPGTRDPALAPTCTETMPVWTRGASREMSRASRIGPHSGP